MNHEESPKPVKLVRALDIAQQLDIAKSQVYRMAREGLIPSVKTGTLRGFRFDLQAVMAALNRPANGNDK